MSSNEVWAMCGDCGEELKQSDKQCPRCGSTKKAYTRECATVIGLKASGSHVHEGLRKHEEKDSGSRYLEQFDRVKRWYEEFKLTDQGRPHDHSSDFYQDQAYAFFQNCWHLKDWIKNDNVGLYEELKGKIHSDTDMQLCRGICDGTKHLKLNLKWHPEDPKFGQRKFRVAVGNGPTTISVKYTIDTSSGRTVDAFELATKCLEFWEDFIRSNTNDEASGGKD